MEIALFDPPLEISQILMVVASPKMNFLSSFVIANGVGFSVVTLATISLVFRLIQLILNTLDMGSAQQQTTYSSSFVRNPSYPIKILNFSGLSAGSILKLFTGSSNGAL